MTEARLPEPGDGDPSTPEPEPAGPPPGDLPEGEPPAFPIPAEIAEYTPEQLAPSLAAVCFALNRAVTLSEASAILGRSRDDVARAADHLAGSLRGGGLMLQRHQDEIQLVTRPEVAWAVQRALNPERPGRLSRAALETLAIVAYRQPLTRGAIEAIRGVNCEAVLDSLERRGLVTEIGRQDTPGHPRLFATTLRFLQVVGLERIQDLPPLPEGLKVPELPPADWEAAVPAPPAAPERTLPEPTMEVRGAAIEHEPPPEDKGDGPNGYPPPAPDDADDADDPADPTAPADPADSADPDDPEAEGPPGPPPE